MFTERWVRNAVGRCDAGDDFGGDYSRVAVGGPRFGSTQRRLAMGTFEE
jgi:hypothetical protein